MKFWTRIVIVICVLLFHGQNSVARHRLGAPTLEHYAGQSYSLVFNGGPDFIKGITAGLDLRKKISKALYGMRRDRLCAYGWIWGKV